MNEEKKLIAITIKVEAANELLKYLSGQPYNQVAAIIDSVQKSQPVYETIEEPKKA